MPHANEHVPKCVGVHAHTAMCNHNKASITLAVVKN